MSQDEVLVATEIKLTMRFRVVIKDVFQLWIESIKREMKDPEVREARWQNPAGSGSDLEVYQRMQRLLHAIVRKEQVRNHIIISNVHSELDMILHTDEMLEALGISEHGYYESMTPAIEELGPDDRKAIYSLLEADILDPLSSLRNSWSIEVTDISWEETQDVT